MLRDTTSFRSGLPSSAEPITTNGNHPMNVLHRGMAATALALVALSASANNLVFNGSFEAPVTGFVSCFANTTSGGWSSSGPAESCYLSNNLANPWPDAVDGLQFMYLGQNMTANVKLEQSVLLEAGTSYGLQFHLAGLDAHPGGTLHVGVGGQSILTVSTPNSDSRWVQHMATFVAGTTGYQALSFVSPTGGVFNIDSVSLTAAPVPEPASWALLAMGGLLVAGAANRRRVQRAS